LFALSLEQLFSVTDLLDVIFYLQVIDVTQYQSWLPSSPSSGEDSFWVSAVQFCKKENENKTCFYEAFPLQQTILLWDPFKVNIVISGSRLDHLGNGRFLPL
jgi:hypothetical protein